jgi:hypothetical protein
MRKTISSDSEEKLTILGSELTKLCGDWMIFDQCYCTSRPRSELLFSAAGGFFSRTHDMMLWSIAAAIARMLDPAAMGKNNNLVIEALLKDICSEGFRSEAVDLLRELKAIRAIAVGILQFRNKRVAHLDEAVLLGRMKLAGFPPEVVEEVLEKIGELLNGVNQLLEKREVVTYTKPYIADDANVLARKIEQANALEAMIKAGKISIQEAKEFGG